MDRHCRLASEKMQGTHSTTANHIPGKGPAPSVLVWLNIMPSHLHSDRVLIVTRVSLFGHCGRRRIVAAEVIRQYCHQQKSQSPQD